MITRSSIKRNKKYYEALGSSPQGVLSPMDFYRLNYSMTRSVVRGGNRAKTLKREVTPEEVEKIQRSAKDY